MATGVTHQKIHVLPEDLVGRIAAGEVVERPAAVVKELIDNSLDAGGTCITIDVTDGGLTRIVVTDDGEGMTREDAVVAFRRHATSKVRSESDLWALRTLGFRGEALPSIAAVSRVELATSRAEATVGTRVRVEGGEVRAVEDVAVPKGTHVDVRNLFFNTPARKKFLKSVTTEFSHILQTVQHAALAWPSVQFRLLHNGKESLQVVPAGSLRERVAQVYRGSLMDHLVPVRAVQPGLSLEGFVIGAEHLRGARTPQEIFVNRRPVKNSTILHAVTDAYGPVLPKGRYPQFLLCLDLDPGRVDVNVHPTKREVRFAEKEWVHQVVRQAVKDALRGGQEPSRSLAPTAPVVRVLEEALGRWSPGAREAEPTAVPRLARSGIETVHEPLFPAWQPAATGATTEVAPASASPGGMPEVVPLGQLGRTYLVACVGDELQVIDQHTAHERVLHERLWRSRQAGTVEAQALLTPVPMELPLHQRALLEPYLGDLERLGLGLERFGSDGYVLRTIPAALRLADASGLVQGLIEELDEWRSRSSLEAKLHLVVATMACHSAVRAGRPMTLPEIGRLVQDWVAEGMMMTCPHGRRVALRLPATELAHIFGRD